MRCWIEPAREVIANCDHLGLRAAALLAALPAELEVTNCDLKLANSSGESWNMKSTGKR
jgi:hypothetical protein